jgi:hypothetical protein
MTQLAKSTARMSWAASVFSAQLAVDLLADGTKKADAALYRVTEAIQQQFSGDPIVYGINSIGDAAQRSAVDFIWDLPRLRVLDWGWLTRTAGAAIAQSVDAARALWPGDNLAFTADVLRNTFAVINLVNRAPSIIGLPPGETPLTAAVERAYSAGDYSAVWLVEGLGEEYANRHWSKTASPSGLLTGGQASTLPEKSLLMMHAGMGISFARHTMGRLTPYSPEPEIAAALERFVALVRANAREGYEGPAFESLGLVTRSWYPRLVAILDRGLWGLDPVVLEYFWHGVGRAICFSPLCLLPGRTAFHGVVREAPHRLAYLNGMAGAAWAFTLVNIRQPAILLNLLRNYSVPLAADDAFTNGLISAVIMASDTLPADPYASALCHDHPQTADEALAQTWDRLVRLPCKTAVEKYFPVLKKHHSLSEVFRYRNLAQLVDRLGGRA